MALTLDLINQVCLDLGGTGGHKMNIDALNEVCTLLGGTGGHAMNIDALNEIQGTTAYKQEIDALNAIITDKGGSGAPYKMSYDAWQAIQQGSLLNLLPTDYDTYHNSIINDLASESMVNADAYFVPPVGVVSPTSYATRTISNFGVTDASGYIEAMVYNDATDVNALSGSKYIFAYNQLTSDNRVFYISLTNNGRIYLDFAEIGGTRNTMYLTAVQAIPKGWVKVKVVSDGSQYLCYANDANVTAVSIVTGTNNGLWLDKIYAALNTLSIGIYRGNATLTSASDAYIAWVDYNNKNKWILNTDSGYVYDIIGGVHLTWTGAGNHKTYSHYGSKQCITSGYSLWQKSASPDIQVPYSSANAPLSLTPGTDVPTGYTKTSDNPSLISGFNGADTFFQPRACVDGSGFQSADGKAASLNSNSGTRTWFLMDRRSRIRYTGNISAIKFMYTPSANTASLKFQIWRLVSTTYTLIHNIDITSLLPASTGIANVKLTTSIAVQENDYMAFCLANSSIDNVLSVQNSAGLTGSAKVSDAERTTGFDWAGATNATFMIANAIMEAPCVVAVGDSIMAGAPGHGTQRETGYGDDNSNQIPNQLYLQNNKLTYQNNAQGGATTTEILSRYITRVRNIRPRICVINGGTNDVAGAVANATIQANIEAVVSLCIADGIYPIVMSIIPYPAGTTAMCRNIDTINAAWATSIPALGGLFVNLTSTLGLYRATGDPGNLWDLQAAYNADGVHMTKAGYTAAAAKIYTDLVASGFVIPDLSKVAIFDGLDATIASATRRASSYFDAANRYRLHISELADFNTLNSFFETDYQDRVFSKLTSGKVMEVLNYGEKKAGGELTAIKKYCGIV